MRKFKKTKRTLIILVSIYVLLIIVSYFPYKTIPVKRHAEKDSLFIKVKGHNVHYKKFGKGRPLVLVHGFAGSTYTWRYLAPLLSKKYTVYAYDVLGFGLTDKPVPGKYDMKSHGEFLIAFMDALKISKATMIGHSMGGVIVGYAALTDPGRIDKLVMIEPGFYNKKIPRFLNYMFFPLDRIMSRQFLSRSMRVRFLKGSFYNKSLVTKEVIDAYMIPNRTPNALESMAYMMSSVGFRFYEGVTDKITSPTFLIWGDKGKSALPEVAKRINGEIKSSKLIMVKGSGHYVQEEKPQKLYKIILDKI
ncbi:alpha/beta fold hydrolase [Spirochaetota bacterium]